MQYQVLIRQPSDECFTASIMGPVNVTADGRTEQEAISKVTTALKSELAAAKVVTVEIDLASEQEETDPWIKYMGIFADDPTFDDFLEEVAKYRAQVDEEMDV